VLYFSFMQVTTIRPSARLAPFVDRFVIVESGDEITRTLLPETGLILGVRYSGAASLIQEGRATRVPDATLTGILGTARRMRTHAGGGIVLAQFRPAGAAPFFRAPLDELFGAHAPLEAILSRAGVQRLGEKMFRRPDHAGRIAVLEEFLLSRMHTNGTDPIAGAAVQAIGASHGSLRISHLARQLGISQDPLEKRFRRAIGTSPKHLASIVRVRHAIALAERGTSLSRVAHDAGYYDQSHFIRDFRAITGDSPTRFFRAGDHC